MTDQFEQIVRAHEADANNVRECGLALSNEKELVERCDTIIKMVRELRRQRSSNLSQLDKYILNNAG